MQTVVITGANRGIGLGLVAKYLSRGARVVAACRNPDGARSLWELESEYPDQLVMEELDLSEDDSINGFASRIKDKVQQVDLLINNAGVLPDQGRGSENLTSEILHKAFRVNTIGTALLCSKMTPLLKAGSLKTIANISSKVGSIEDNSSGGHYAYRMSKSALNMFNKCFAIENKDLTAVVLHPGWVQTDMGGPNALIDVMTSVDGMVGVLDKVTTKDSGKFLNYDGSEIPW